jgi:hypothetical protein
MPRRSPTSSPPGLTRWSMLKCNFSSHTASLRKRRCRMDCRVKPGNDERKSSRGACASEFCQCHGHEKPSSRKAMRTKSHARVERREAPGSWATPRGRMFPPAHASGVARATEDPLARTACFGRAAPPGAPPPSRFSAAAVDRRCASSAPATPSGRHRQPASARYAGQFALLPGILA